LVKLGQFFQRTFLQARAWKRRRKLSNLRETFEKKKGEKVCANFSLREHRATARGGSETGQSLSRFCFTLFRVGAFWRARRRARVVPKKMNLLTFGCFLKQCARRKGKEEVEER
jgi:hypothetical protein